MTKQNMRRLRIPGQDNYVNNKIHKHPNLQLNLHISKRIFLSQKREGGQVWLLDLRLDSGLAPRAGGGLEGGFGAGPPNRGGLEAGFGAGPPNKGVWRLDSGLAPRTGGSGGWIRGWPPNKGAGGWIRGWPPEQGGLNAFGRLV